MKIVLSDESGTTLTFALDEDGDMFVSVDDGIMGPVKFDGVRKAVDFLEAQAEDDQA